MTTSRRRILFVAVTACFAAIAFTSNAFAVDVGNRCVASQGAIGTKLQTGGAAVVSKYTVPEGGGIVTKWGSNVIPYGGGIFAKMKLFRPAGVAGKYTVVGETDSQPIPGGYSEFNVRFPVSGGEIFAEYSAQDALSCTTTDVSDVSSELTIGTEPTIGTTVTAGATTTSSQVAIYAVVEPDVDHDGFGDESQDQCPRSAALQTPCPEVKVASTALPQTAKSSSFLVTTNTTAPVSIAGTISIKLPKAGSKKSKTRTFKLGPVTKTVSPGQLANLTVKYPKSLTNALKAFPASKKFQLKLTITGTGAANADTTVITQTLRGTK